MQNNFFKAIMPLFLVIFIDSIGLGIIFPILTPIFMASDGIMAVGSSPFMRDFFYGLTMAVFPLFMFFSTPLLGDLSDQIGRKKVIMICLLGAGLSYLISAYAVISKNITLLIVSRMLAGLTAGSEPIAQAAVIDICPLEKKAVYISWFIFPIAIGFVAGPLIGGYLSHSGLVKWFDLWTPLAAAGLLALINAGLLWFGFKDSRSVTGKIKFEILRALLMLIPAIKDKKLRLILLVFFLYQLGWSCYFQYVSLFLLNKHHTAPEKIGLFMSLGGLGFAIAALLGTKLILKILTLSQMILVSLVTIFIGIFSTVLPDSAAYAWGWIIPLGIAALFVYTGITTLLSNKIDQNQQGWIMGVIAAIAGLAWFVSGMFAGLLQSISYSAPLFIAACIVSLGAALMAFYNCRQVSY